VNELGQKLRSLRGERSLLDVTKGTGIAKIDISRYEKGERVPNPERLKRLAEFYQIAYPDLRTLYFQDVLVSKEERDAVLLWVLRNLSREELTALLAQHPDV
jgi:transcriptional regulator with XRE-family HTH domain